LPGKVDLNEDTPMMITYNTKKTIDSPKGIVTNKHAHPALSTQNLLIGSLIRFIQVFKREISLKDWVNDLGS
jgi:hypothetical protein